MQASSPPTDIFRSCRLRQHLHDLPHLRAPKEVHRLLKVVESERVFSLKWSLLLIISLLFIFSSKDRRSGLCVEEFRLSGQKQR